MDNAVIIAIIVGLFGLPATIVSFVIASRQSRTKEKLAENTVKIEEIKTEALSKAEILKTQTDAQADRLEQLLDTQAALIKNLQDENRQQRKELNQNDKLHREEILAIKKEINELTLQMNICIAARTEFQAKSEQNQMMLDAAVAQYKNIQKFYEDRLQGKIDEHGDEVKIEGKMTKLPKTKDKSIK